MDLVVQLAILGRLVLDQTLQLGADPLNVGLVLLHADDILQQLTELALDGLDCLGEVLDLLLSEVDLLLEPVLLAAGQLLLLDFVIECDFYPTDADVLLLGLAQQVLLLQLGIPELRLLVHQQGHELLDLADEGQVVGGSVAEGRALGEALGGLAGELFLEQVHFFDIFIMLWNRTLYILWLYTAKYLELRLLSYPDNLKEKKNINLFLCVPSGRN